MTAAREPFVQIKIARLLNVGPMLRKSAGQVLWVIACFGGDPIGPSAKDLSNYTGLARQHVARAVEFLCIHHLADCFVGEDGIKRYRPGTDYFHYGGREPVSVRVLVPVSGLQRESGDADHGTQNVPSPVVSSSIESPFCERHKLLTADSEKTFAILTELSTPVEEPGLSKLARTVSPENAHAWFLEWLPQAPASFKAPLAFAVKRLMADPNARPPQGMQKRFWYDDYKEHVQR